MTESADPIPGTRARLTASAAGLLNTCLEWLRSLSPRHALLKELRPLWGRAGTKDSWLAGRYYELRPPVAALDDKTWRDLELPRIFADLDTTVTPLGSQHLFRQLRDGAGESGAASQTFALGQLLRRDTGLREGIQSGLAPLRADSCGHIADLLFGALPANLRSRHYLLAWSVVCLVVHAGV